MSAPSPRGGPLAALRDALLVARFDLVASLRSRKALILLVLYVAGAGAGTAGFVSVLHEVENALADQLGVARADKPGAMAGELARSDELVDVIGSLVGDPALATDLLSIPPVALFYGWLALTFVPVLVTLTSSDAIAGDVETGSARFALIRTGRGAWAVGKLLGQAALMAAGVALGGVASLLVAVGGTVGFPLVEGALWIARLGGRACILGFSWLGLMLGASQLVRTANKARALGLFALVSLGVGRQILAHAPPIRERFAALADSLLQLFPGTHVLPLWQPVLADRLPAVAILLALGGTFFFLGHLRFASRDA